MTAPLWLPMGSIILDLIFTHPLNIQAESVQGEDYLMRSKKNIQLTNLFIQGYKRCDKLTSDQYRSKIATR